MEYCIVVGKSRPISQKSQEWHGCQNAFSNNERQGGVTQYTQMQPFSHVIQLKTLQSMKNAKSISIAPQAKDVKNSDNLTFEMIFW